MYLVLPTSLYVDFVPLYDFIQISQTEFKAYDFTTTIK